MKRLAMIFVLLFCHPAQATVLLDANLDSAPTSEADGGVYTGGTGTLELELRNGETPADMFDHVTGSDCYSGSGGCAKFYPNTSTLCGSAGTYRSFISDHSGGTTQLNIRYLLKWNSTLSNSASYGVKGGIYTQNGRFWPEYAARETKYGVGLQFCMGFDNTTYYVHGNGVAAEECLPTTGKYCCPYETDCNLGSGMDVAGPFLFRSWDDEWVVFEYEMLSTGTRRAYIWTQDGTYNGLYMEVVNQGSGDTGIESSFGPAMFTDECADSGSYWMMDDVIIADTYIGPPSGFVGGSDNMTLGIGLDNIPLGVGGTITF